MRFDVIARGAKGHSGVAGTGDLSEKLIAARGILEEALPGEPIYGFVPGAGLAKTYRTLSQGRA